MKVFLGLLCCFLATTLSAEPGQLSGVVEGSYRYFIHDLPGTTPPNHTLSIKASPTYSKSFKEGQLLFTANPFLRIDQHDGNRSHFDFRELSLIYVASNYELRAGLMTVFWGVTESTNIVDIINQNDLVEGVTSSEKLGQQMINISTEKPYGLFDFYLLPGFRPSTFPSQDGRFNFGLNVNNSKISFESPQEEWHLDWATRWEHSLGSWDLGLHFFSGTDRTPQLQANDSNNPTELLVHYVPIQQVGLDAQYTWLDTLVKIEAINRSTSRSRFHAYTLGIEHSLYGKIKPTWDFGLLTEYLFDERGKSGFTPNENDLFLGVRWVLNNTQGTECIAGTTIDLDSGAKSYRLETSHRLTNNWKVELIAQTFAATDPNDLVYFFRNDDVIELNLGYWF